MHNKKASIIYLFIFYFTWNPSKLSHLVEYTTRISVKCQLSENSISWFRGIN